MKIELYEPERAKNSSFFRYVFSALLKCKGARGLPDPRPLPRVTEPREHESAWIRVDGHLVFFDMSDHVFLYDVEALKRCDVYFKTNLNRPITERVLRASALSEHGSKILPFFSFAQNLELYAPRSLRNRLARLRRGERYDVCHIVGVYENRVHDGETSVFAGNESAIDPSRYHFWIRYHCMQQMRASGINGYYRLISRGNRAIEDNQHVFQNLTQWDYIQKILASRVTFINTLPHAIFPWKVTEVLALGKPFVTECRPLIELPEPFAPKPGVHYLELLPGQGDFDHTAPLGDPAAYRLLQPVSPDALGERCDWLREKLGDREGMAYMTAQVERYAREVLRHETVADFICDTVRGMIH